METPLTPLEFMRRARRLFGSKEAAVDGSVRVTYEELFDRCDRWSAVLQRLGVKPGDRVAYIASNTLANLESFYAVPQIGAVLVPINYRLTADDFAYIIAHSGAKVVCAAPEYLEAQRKMNEEIMGLYRSEGVNTAGGCLPMLLQLPILFAFFKLLTATVELRNAPWMLWILDLSSRDPYYVLPIVMGATQWFQVRMAPQSGDPMQRRMFELMPVIMTVMFIGVPSGLVLYWLTNNVLTILQQAVYKRLERRKA